MIYSFLTSPALSLISVWFLVHVSVTLKLSFFFLSFFFFFNTTHLLLALGLGHADPPDYNSLQVESLPPISKEFLLALQIFTPSLHDLRTPVLGHVPIYVISISDILPIILHDNFLSLKKKLVWGPSEADSGTKKCSLVGVWFCMCCVKLLQLFLILCNATDCSLPGSSVRGILQARTLEWVAISSSRGSSRPRDQTHISCSSCIVRRLLYL